MIKISNLQKRFDDLEVLRDVNIDVAEGEVVCIIGPSGSGKSTLLRCINQLETPTAGRKRKIEQKQKKKLWSCLAKSTWRTKRTTDRLR